MTGELFGEEGLTEFDGLLFTSLRQAGLLPDLLATLDDPGAGAPSKG